TIATLPSSRPTTEFSCLRSDPDEVGQPLPMVIGAAEKELRILRAFEVQVCGVLPGEADAAENLDVFTRGVQVRVATERLGEAGQLRHLGVAGGYRPQRVIRSGSGGFEFDEHRCALVLDRLERSDGAAELLA